MRLIVQRVRQAEVNIDGKRHSAIGCGLLVFLGIEHEDTVDDIEWLVRKLVNLRIFADREGVMNLSVNEVKGMEAKKAEGVEEVKEGEVAGGEILIVSQFTLHASTKKGNRPSYIKAARPEIAVPLYREFISRTKEACGGRVEEGIFGADMQVGLINDGPVTIFIDSKIKE